MKELNLQIGIRIYDEAELDAADRQLVAAACEATQRSYAPYSHFSVGAAARLADGTIVSGSNQENASVPSEPPSSMPTHATPTSLYARWPSPPATSGVNT